MRIRFDRIEANAIPTDFTLDSGIEKFSHWPVQFDLNLFHRDRLRKSLNDHTLLFIASTDSQAWALIEITFNLYDSSFFGFKCCSLSNLFFNSIPLEKREFLLEQSYNFLIDYLKKEKIKFCNTSINSWTAVSSSEAQKIGFKYVVTWGDCFVSEKSSSQLPDGYYIGNTKNERDLPALLEMTKKYFTGGRFYLDPMFKSFNINKLYEDLVVNSFNDPKSLFSILYNSKDIPVGCFIYKNVLFNEVKVAALRFLIYNQALSVKGLSTKFLSKTSDNLLQQASLVSSGIELHNLASLKIHADAGYKFNNIHSAYHLWV